MIPLDKLANIQIPPPLKKQLVDDCDFITHLGKVLYPLCFTVHLRFLVFR